MIAATCEFGAAAFLGAAEAVGSAAVGSFVAALTMSTVASAVTGKWGSSGRTEECKKLFRYRMRDTRDPKIPRDHWSIYYAYVRLIEDSSCKLIVAVPLVGPGASDEAVAEQVRLLTLSIPELFFRNTPYKASQEIVEVIGGRNKTHEWCEKLPVANIDENDLPK